MEWKYYKVKADAPLGFLGGNIFRSREVIDKDGKGYVDWWVYETAEGDWYPADIVPFSFGCDEITREDAILELI